MGPDESSERSPFKVPKSKGLYRKALEGQIENFAGASDPYEPLLNVELVVDTETETPRASAGHILAKLEQKGFIVLPHEVAYVAHKRCQSIRPSHYTPVCFIVDAVEFASA